MHQCKLRLAVIEADGREGGRAAGRQHEREGEDGVGVQMVSPLLYPHQLSQSTSTPCTLGQHRYLLALCGLPLLGGHRLNWAMMC